MNANGVQTGEPSKELPSAEDFMKEATKDWIDEEALKGQRTLDLLNSLIKANEKYIQAFYYWFCTESVYSYRDVDIMMLSLKLFLLLNIIVLIVVIFC